jgi:hypothetical protein
MDDLRLGLRAMGWIEGTNLVIEIRWVGVNPQRQRELAAELKALPVALILALCRPWQTWDAAFGVPKGRAARGWVSGSNRGRNACRCTAKTR